MVTSTLTLRGRRGTYGTGPALVARRVPKSWTPRLFAWQAWHLVTSTFTLRGRRGAWWHRLSLCMEGVPLTARGRLWWRTGFPNDTVEAAALCVAGVALGDIHFHFAWQAWHLARFTFVSRGRRGTWRDFRFVWQVWHLWHWAASGGRLGALGRRWRRGTLRGRRGACWRHPPSFRVAGVALGDIYLRFAWQV